MNRDAFRMVAVRLVVAAAWCLAVVPVAHAGTVHVADNGVDSAGCGAKADPCQTITQAIQNAVAGDKIVVGPGTYRDESGAPGCDCFVAVDKRVKLMSEDGAAATVIDASRFLVASDVLLIADGTQFGRPGQGFTVTNPDALASTGIAIDSKHVKVRGNQAIGRRSAAAQSSPGTGIAAVEANPGPMLIQGNQVVSWEGAGIQARGDGKTVDGNQISLVGNGIVLSGSSTATGNVVTDAVVGIALFDGASATGNSIVGGKTAIEAEGAFSGTISGNDLVGNSTCGLFNHSTVATIVAANNYWGAATGPGPAPANPVCNDRNHVTLTTPFASTPFAVKAPIEP